MILRITIIFIILLPFLVSHLECTFTEDEDLDTGYVQLDLIQDAWEQDFSGPGYEGLYRISITGTVVNNGTKTAFDVWLKIWYYDETGLLGSPETLIGDLAPGASRPFLVSAILIRNF